MKCVLIYFCGNRSRIFSVVYPFGVLVDYVVEIQEAATHSRFSESLMSFYKADVVLQPRGGGR